MNGTLDQRFLPLIFDSSPLGIFTVDGNNLITSFNRTASEITGYSAKEAIGKRCFEVFRADVCQQDCPLKRSVRTRKKQEENEVSILNKQGDELSIAVSTAALQDEKGKVVGGLEMFRDLRPVLELRKRLEGSYVFEDIISKNREMQKILEYLPLIAASPSTVMIEGASGTGKELVARALHNLGPRKLQPFIAVNCAALPDNLLESELFGYVKGAFTDAKADKPGRFTLADGGSLFLDEIGELSPAMQVKLLRVLQEREFEPLGATKSVKVDVRLICATNKDLSVEVEKKHFREDLYYRLNVVCMSLPPLGDRRDDIPLLVEHFIRRFNALQGRQIKHASKSAMDALMNAPYPGNVRELENAIEHAFVLCQGDTIRLEHLPPAFETLARMNLETPTENELYTCDDLTPIQQAEGEVIRRALLECSGNRTKAAKLLGISRNTLWRKMKRLGV